MFPFKRIGAEHIKLQQYLRRLGRICYQFEGEEYSISIKEVLCYPQCFAAVASRIGNMKGRYVVVIFMHILLLIPSVSIRQLDRNGMKKPVSISKVVSINAPTQCSVQESKGLWMSVEAEA